MTESRRVLVTGSAGHIGKAVVAELLARGRPVRGFDRVATPNLTDYVVGDLTDAATVQRALEGVDTLVHLAATPDDVDDVVGELVPSNIVGVYHLFEAARRRQVRRMIVASSLQVVWWQAKKGPWPIRIDTQPTPRSWYAATKTFLEAAARAYAEAHHISVIVVRVGWCPRSPAQIQEVVASDWAQNLYLSHADAGRFFACAVDAPPSISHALVYAASKPPKTAYLDLQPARDLLGYEPRDTWPEGVELG